MTNLLKTIQDKLFGVEGAAHACKKTAYFWTIYQEDGGWFFSWFDEKHSQGAVNGPFQERGVAERTQERWENANRAEFIVLQA